jgi:hypothetical protein
MNYASQLWYSSSKENNLAIKDVLYLQILMALKFNGPSKHDSKQPPRPDSGEPTSSDKERGSSIQEASRPQYPLWQAVLALRGLPLQPSYSLTDVAHAFECSLRAIQKKVQQGKLVVRDIPPYGSRCLNEDLEEYLGSSKKKPSGGRKSQK